MGNDRFTEHAQNLLGCEKCNLMKAVGNSEMPIGCEIKCYSARRTKTYYNSVMY